MSLVMLQHSHVDTAAATPPSLDRQQDFSERQTHRKMRPSASQSSFALARTTSLTSSPATRGAEERGSSELTGVVPCAAPTTE